MPKNRDTINILLISDAPERAGTVREVLDAVRPNCRLHAIRASHSAVAYLRREGDYANVPENDLILLDLVEPTSADIHLLRRIKADRKLATIPIVLLTTAESEEVIAVLSDNRRNQIMFSSIDLNKFVETMGSIRRDRFLSALQLIENLGYVPVRLPQPSAQRPTRATG